MSNFNFNKLTYCRVACIKYERFDKYETITNGYKRTVLEQDGKVVVT